MAIYHISETQIVHREWQVDASSASEARRLWEASGSGVQLITDDVQDSQGLTISLNGTIIDPWDDEA